MQSAYLTYLKHPHLISNHADYLANLVTPIVPKLNSNEVLEDNSRPRNSSSETEAVLENENNNVPSEDNQTSQSNDAT